LRANFVLSSVAAGLRRNVTMTIALVLSSMIALFFVGSAFLANTEIGRFKTRYEDKINVSIYLCAKDFVAPCTHQTTPAEKDTIDRTLTSDPSVASFKYLDETAVYNREKAIQDPQILKSGVFKPGVLPATYIVHLKDLRKDFAPFDVKYARLGGVGAVTNQSDAFKTLLNIIDGAAKGAVVIAIVVLFGCVLLIANAVQLAANHRKEETGIMRLVGASRWMTELPFILETVIAVVVGGLIAIGAVAVGKLYLLDNIFDTQTKRGVIPNLNANDILIAGGAGLLVGIVLAAITAFATLRLVVKL
jgi:cell division transport system permease protein